MYLSLEDFQALGVDDTYKNHSIGGKCSGGGECCVDMASLPWWSAALRLDAPIRSERT